MKLSAIAVLIALLISCNNESKTDSATTSDSSNAAAAKDATTSETKAEEWTPVDDSTAMKAMMEAGTPGPEQAMLAKDNGNWKAEVTMWEKPGAAPMTSKGMLSNKMILGGRYQVTSFKGDMMGMPFEGTGTTAYDKARKVWVSTWTDNMSTGIMNMEGIYDAATRTMTFTGKMLCPANGKWCEMKQVMKKLDDNTEVMEMYGPDMQTGKSFKNMEMKMTRG